MVYANGDVYCGEFLAGAKHGAGILTLAAVKGQQGPEEEEGKAVGKHGGEYAGEFEND